MLQSALCLQGMMKWKFCLKWVLVKSKEIRLKRLKALLRRGMQTALNIIHFHLTHLSFHLGIEFKYAIFFEN